MTNGLDYPEAYIVLPAGPAEMFVAVNTPEIVGWISETEPCGLVRDINAKVIGQAVRYVYDTTTPSYGSWSAACAFGFWQAFLGAHGLAEPSSLRR